MRISDWYPAFGCYSFPTVFVQLRPDEVAALVAGEVDGEPVQTVSRRLQAAIRSLPGSCFVHADCCAPTDAPDFVRGRRSVRSGRSAWTLLSSSDKVRAAFAAGDTERLGVHSFRRLDPVREFRLFVFERRLAAVSQMCLLRHFARLAGRRREIWRKSQALTAEIIDFIAQDQVVVDVYLTSAGHLLIIDLNAWGPPTEPLLLRNWNQDWGQEFGVRLIPKPTRLKGDVEVSF